MIRDTLLNGISDSDIRREVLRTADILTMAINDVIALVESKEMARNAMSIPDVSAVSAFRRQLATPPNEDCRPSSSRHPSQVKTSPSERSPRPICKQPFSVYREGPRGWNTKPYTPNASTASAHVGAISGGNPCHLRCMLSQTVAEHLMRQAI